MFLARRGATESYGADLGSCPTNSEVKTKKRSSAQNLRLVVYIKPKVGICGIAGWEFAGLSNCGIFEMRG